MSARIREGVARPRSCGWLARASGAAEALARVARAIQSRKPEHRTAPH